MRLKNFRGLKPLRLELISGHYSRGCDVQAKVLADAGNQAYAYLKGFFHQEPEIDLFVLNFDDWRKLKLPQKYEHGPFFMPYSKPYMVYYGSDVPEFWTSALLTLCETAPEELKKDFLSIVGREDEDFKSSFFRTFDLDLFSFTIVHEFTHVFCENNHVLLQIIADPSLFSSDLAWFTEFFCQYAFYSFLKTRNDDYAEKWFSLGKLCYEGGKLSIKYTDLRNFGRRYKEMISTMEAANLLWYQFGKFMLMAEELYEKFGESFIKKTVEEMEYKEENFLNLMQSSFRNFESWFQNWMT